MTERHYVPIEVRALADADEGEGILEGYASVFDTEYGIGLGMTETISQGAFADSLKDRDGVIPIYHEHGWRRGAAPIGVARAEEDEHGLKVEAELFVDDDSTARSVWRAAEAGALREWSIGFLPQVEEHHEDDDLVNVVEAELLEASTVLVGANPDTEMVGVRAKPIDAAENDDDQDEGDTPAPEEDAAEEPSQKDGEEREASEEPAVRDLDLDSPLVRDLLREEAISSGQAQ